MNPNPHCTPGEGRRYIFLALAQSSITQWALNIGIIDVLSQVSPVRLFGTPWAVAHEAYVSMVFSRQGYWRG